MKVILIDLGGVLVDVVSSRRLGELIGGHMTPDEVSRRWAQSESLRLFESGLCDRDTFAVAAIRELNLDITQEKFLDEFALFLKGLYPGAAELLRSIPVDYALACLTDTNALQWDSLCERFSIDKYFRHHFLSYRIGCVKPDARVYRHVIDHLGCDPGEIVYFDDNAANIEAGLAAGLGAHRVVGVAELAHRLRALGIL